MALTRLSAPFAAPSLWERVGRKAAMDFGFGAFLEKFETYFGKTLTRLMVGLMGTAVAAACLSLIGHLAITMMHLAKPGEQNRMGELVLLFQIVVLAWGAYAAINWHLQLRRFKRERAEIPPVAALLDKTKELHQQVVESRAELFETTEKMHRDFEENVVASELVLDQVIAVAIAQGAITQEQAEWLLSLRDTAPEKLQ